MKRYQITQIKSAIDRPEVQKKTLVALGIKKMNVSVDVDGTPQIEGMIHKIKHLLKVVEIN